MKKIFFILLLTIAIINTHAQFAAALSKNGFVRLNNDSIILSIPAGIRGDIQWQSTNDLITWENEEANLGNALAFKPMEIKSYRLVIKEGACDSLFSDTCKVFPANTTIPEYIAYGISALDLFNTGIMVGTLEKNGVHAQDLIDAGLTGYVSDVEGNNYKWVKIGTQIWMAENLRTTKLNNGDSIPLIENGSEWEIADSPAYCWYDNLPENGSVYGALYNWFTVTSEYLCPVGWHVPNNNDWQKLITYLGGEEVAGGKLKQLGTEYWQEPNEEGTNESGFTALPGGCRFYPHFDYLSQYACFWSTTPGLDEMACSFQLINDRTECFSEDISGPESGRSVRCLEDPVKSNVLRAGIELTTEDIPALKEAIQQKAGEIWLWEAGWDKEETFYVVKFEYLWELAQNVFIDVFLTVAESKELAYEYLIERLNSCTLPLEPYERLDQPAIAGNISYDNGSNFIRDNIVIEMHPEGISSDTTTEIAKQIDGLIIKSTSYRSVDQLKPLINRFEISQNPVKEHSVTKLIIDVQDPNNRSVLFHWRFSPSSFSGGIQKDELENYYYTAGFAYDTIPEIELTLIVTNDYGFCNDSTICIQIEPE